jgi:hypothetical protein
MATLAGVVHQLERERDVMRQQIEALDAAMVALQGRR